MWGALRALHFLRAEFIFSSSVGGTIISQPMANQTIVVLTPNGINFPQTETPKPTNQTQDSLEKRLKAEIKVLGVSPIQTLLDWDDEGAQERTEVLRPHRDYGGS